MGNRHLVPIDGGVDPRVTRAPRRRRFRRHTPHFYLVLIAVACAIGLCPLEIAAYLGKSLTVGAIACIAAGITTVAVSVSFFWGFFLLLNGQLSSRRFRIVFPHAAVGTLSPLLYMLNFSLALDGAGHRPVSMPLVALSLFSVFLLGIQFVMGRSVVYRPRPRIVHPADDSLAATVPRL